tara:strand:- start:89 stop:553 length:465 start_codon:yes stop_codon:yes gene_type:complete
MAKTPFKLRSGNTTPFKMMGSSPMRKDEKKQKLKEVNPFDLYTRPGTPNGESDPKQDAMGKGFGKEGSVKKSTSPNITPPVRGKTVKVSTPPKKNNPNVSSEPKYPESATIWDKILYDKEGYRRRFGINNPEKREKIKKRKEEEKAEVDAWKKN